MYLIISKTASQVSLASGQALRRGTTLASAAQLLGKALVAMPMVTPHRRRHSTVLLDFREVENQDSLTLPEPRGGMIMSILSGLIKH